MAVTKKKRKVPVKKSPVIKLDNEYQITLDKYCYILQRKVKKGDKEMEDFDLGKLDNEEEENEENENEENENKDNTLAPKKSNQRLVTLGYFSTWGGIAKNLIRWKSCEVASEKNNGKAISIADYCEIIQEQIDYVENLFKGFDTIVNGYKEKRGR